MPLRGLRMSYHLPNHPNNQRQPEKDILVFSGCLCFNRIVIPAPHIATQHKSSLKTISRFQAALLISGE